MANYMTEADAYRAEADALYQQAMAERDENLRNSYLQAVEAKRRAAAALDYGSAPGDRSSENYIQDPEESNTPYYSDDDLATMMIRGNFGNMNDRLSRFKAFGGYSDDDYRRVQNLVNQRLRGGKSYGNQATADYVPGLGKFHDTYTIHDNDGDVAFVDDSGNTVYYDDLGYIPQYKQAVEDSLAAYEEQSPLAQMASKTSVPGEISPDIMNRIASYSANQPSFNSRREINGNRINKDREMMDQYFADKAALKQDYRTLQANAGSREERRQNRRDYLDARSSQRADMRAQRRALNIEAREQKRRLRGG